MAQLIPLDRPASPRPIGSPKHRRDLQVVRVVAWGPPEDTLMTGVDPRSMYVERFWLPLLGAQATWLARRLADRLDSEPDGFDLEVDEAVRTLGLWGPGGSRSSFRRAVLRCVRHGFLRHRQPGTLAVRLRAPTVPPRELVRLPLPLQADHRRWEADQSAAGIDEARRRARRVALDLLSVEDELGLLERRLLGFGVHPALASESAGWAWELRSDVRREP